MARLYNVRYVCLNLRNGKLEDMQPDPAQAVYGEYYKLVEDARKHPERRFLRKQLNSPLQT